MFNTQSTLLHSERYKEKQSWTDGLLMLIASQPGRSSQGKTHYQITNKNVICCSHHTYHLRSEKKKTGQNELVHI